MGVNVTQLLNEEIKVTVQGGDNIATKTELNAGLDLKANKVVGGVFNGMDLKAAAEKLNTDKQNVIVDSGWQEASMLNGWTTHASIRALRYRKIGNIVRIYGEINGVSAADNIAFNIVSGYRPDKERQFFITNTTTGFGQVAIISSGGIFSTSGRGSYIIDLTIMIGN